jgi:hypothetical protein
MLDINDLIKERQINPVLCKFYKTGYYGVFVNASKYILKVDLPKPIYFNLNYKNILLAAYINDLYNEHKNHIPLKSIEEIF